MIKKIIKQFASAIIAGVIIFTGVLGTISVVNGATIPVALATFQTSLQSSISASDTSMTLVTGTDKAGNTLSGYICFTIDEGSSVEEFTCGTTSGTAVTSMIRGIDPIDGDLEVTALKKRHGRGASVKVTTYPVLGILARILNGIETIPNKLTYASAPTFSSGNELVTKTYADGLAIAGAPDASTTVKGIGEEATQAEIDASTGAGGTSARLFINPSTLATSIYGTRLPSATEKEALVGTSGTPSTSNKYVTNDDTSNSGASGKIVRLNGTTYPAGDGTNITNTGLTSYTFGETISAGEAVYYKSSDGKLYKASAATANESLYNYIGIAYESGVANDVKKVYDKDGQVVTGLSLGATTTAVSSTVAVAQSDGGTTVSALYASGITPGTVFVTSPTQNNIEKITIEFGSATGTGGGPVTLNLYEVTGFAGSTITPSASLGSVTVTLPTASATNTFTFSSPVTVKPNTQYLVHLTASGGNGSNHWSIKINSSTVARTFFPTTNTTTIDTSNLTGRCFNMSIYTTSQYNYAVNDNIYLSDTAGTLSFTSGTVPLVVGKILSSSSIQLGIPKHKKKISSVQLAYGSGVFNSIAIPRNTTSIEYDFFIQTASWAGGYSNFDFEIGGLTTKKLSVNDGAGSTVWYNTAEATFGSTGKVSAVSTVSSVNGTTVNITFYK